MLKWPKKITIVRHGESEQNVALDLVQEDLEGVLDEQKRTRDADIKLTETGVNQASKTGQYLSTQDHYDVCFASPYDRTLKTAEEIVKNIGYDLEILKDFRIREKEFGRLHGYTTKEIKKKYPEEFEDRERDGKFYYRLPRGENYLDVGDRVHSFLNKVHRNYAGKNVLIVTHQVPYLMFRALFEHLGEKEILNLGKVPNCGIEEFVIDTENVDHGRMKLDTYNKVAYH